jgi:hypothetical protein
LREWKTGDPQIHSSTSRRTADFADSRRFLLAAMPPDISLASAQVMKLDGLFFICTIREV